MSPQAQIFYFRKTWQIFPCGLHDSLNNQKTNELGMKTDLRGHPDHLLLGPPFFKEK